MTAPITAPSVELVDGIVRHSSDETFQTRDGRKFLVTPDRYEDGYDLIDMDEGRLILESTSHTKCMAWLNDPERPWNWEDAT